MTNGGGDHGSEEEGRETGQEARSKEDRSEEGREGQEDREEVVLPAVADPSADLDSVYLVGAGGSSFPVLVGRTVRRPAQVELHPDAVDKSGILIGRLSARRITLPPHLQNAKMSFEPVYKDEDEKMRLVREVNEDPCDELIMRVEATLPVALERISVSLHFEEK